MAKTKKAPSQPQDTPKPAPDGRNYELQSHAVDDLVDAQRGRAKAYSEQELNRFRTHKGIVLKEWIKVLLLKWWFAGVVCYFMIWGLGNYLHAVLDLFFVVGVAMGLVTELLLNTLLRFMEQRPHENDDWQMIPHTKFVSLPANILYAFIVLLCVYETYVTFNRTMAEAAGDVTSVALGIEPIVFGILYTVFDLLFIGMKRMLKRIFRDAKAKVDGAGR